MYHQMNRLIMENWVIEHANEVQVILFFALFAVLLFVEVIVPFRRQPSREERWKTNLALTVLNIVVLSAIPVTFFGTAVWAFGKGIGILNYWILPLWLTAAGTLLGRGFISFFTHFLMHKVPILWRLHEIHHLDTEMDVTTTVRFHPLEFVTNVIIGAPIVIVLGFAPWVLLFYEILDAGVTLFSHANITLPGWIDRWLRYIIVTPDLHRIHHSSWQPETDSNYSAVFPIWDVIFGTFRTDTRDPQRSMELGLEKVRDERVNRFGWLLWRPFRRKDEAITQLSNNAD